MNIVPAPVAALVPEWRGRAEDLRRYGAAEGPARAWEEAAVELDRALRAWDDELLTLTAAAAECGYSSGHLQRLASTGVIPNRGRRNAPRLRRGDLPVKQSHLRTSGPDDQLPDVSRVQIAQSIVTRS